MKGRKPKPTAIKKQDGTADPWRNRIVGQGDEAPDQLLANPSNWRIHPTAQREALAAVLDDVGWVQRVIVNRTTQHVVDGHLRVALALSRDEPTIPVNYVELDEREEALVLAALDPIAAMAATDKDKLRELLEQAQVTDEALRDQLNDVAGIKAALKEGKTDPDAMPDKRPTEIKRGDLFALGDHRLLCGDSTNADDVALLMDGKHAELLFTSPPYCDSRDYGTEQNHDTLHLASFINRWSKYVNLMAINLGIVRVQHKVVPYWDVYLNAAADADMILVAWNVWDRGRPWTLGQHMALFGLEHEFIFVLSNGKPKQLTKTVPTKGGLTTHINRRADGSFENPYSDDSSRVKSNTHRTLGSVVRDIGPAHLESEKGLTNEHSARFPVALVSLYIEAVAPSIIVEPFAGSGTTLIAAEQLGRRCYAIEIEPTYCQVTIDRWEAFTGEKAKKVQP